MKMVLSIREILFYDFIRISIKNNRHYKIFCVNVKYGIQYGFRIFYLIALQNEENYEREESCSA